MSRRDRRIVRAQRLENLSPHERVDSLLRLNGYLWHWHEGLRRQALRIAEAGIYGMGPECWLYACALGAFLRCVHLAGDLGAEVSGPLAAFDSSARDARAVRDVLEHLEDYELGVGDRQNARQGRLEFLWGRHGDGTTTLQLQGVDLEVEFTALQAAVEQLYEATLEATGNAVEAARGVR